MSVVARHHDQLRYPLAAHHPLGLSTGVLSEDRGDWPSLVARVRDVSSYVAELSALSSDELPGLLAYLRSNPRLPFRYLSVHAPVKGSSERDAELLGQLPLWVRAVVVHPDVLGSDLAPLRRLGSRLLLENMDSRKGTGRTVSELAPFFDQLPDAGFCFDIAHAWSNDATMALGDDLLDAFRSRLRHVHLSSLGADGQHQVLTAEHEELFAGVLDRCRDVPWVLEALPPARWERPQR